MRERLEAEARQWAIFQTASMYISTESHVKSSPALKELNAEIFRRWEPPPPLNDW